jgi:DNA (cytosine-5)-methyltransferase 1
MKIANLYCGLGGNRSLWAGHEITAVEINESIAAFYKDHFPEDKVIISDAHQYLLEHYAEFDLIWSSIECPSHSKARFWASRPNRKMKPVYPDFRLYEEIVFLKHYYDGLWVVENVNPYYEPLIPPTTNLSRHLFWSNFHISGFKQESNHPTGGNNDTWSEVSGFDISNYSFSVRRDKILRNCVPPSLGLHVLNCAINKEVILQKTIFD